MSSSSIQLTDIKTVTRNPPTAGRRRSRAIKPGEWFAGIVLSVLVLLGLFPYLFMLSISFKTNEQFFETFWVPAFPLHLENYAIAWDQIAPYFVSTITVAVVSVVISLALCGSAGFVLARYEFIGKRTLFLMLAILLMVPGIASLIPLFIMMRDLELLNTTAVLIIPQVVGGTVIGTILVKGFVEGLPQEIFDAAYMDGANGVRIFFSIVLPLSAPTIGTIGLLIVIAVWGEFFWPLLTITDNELRTIPVGLSFFQGQNATNWGPLFAGYALASLPLLILFIFLSRYLLAGIQGGLSVNR